MGRIVSGRHGRAVLGSVIILADLGVFLNDHVRLHLPWTSWQEPAVHAGFFVAGLLLIDPQSAREVVMGVVSRLPFTKKGP